MTETTRSAALLLQLIDRLDEFLRRERLRENRAGRVERWRDRLWTWLLFVYLCTLLLAFPLAFVAAFLMDR